MNKSFIDRTTFQYMTVFQFRKAFNSYLSSKRVQKVDKMINILLE
jgi:hypothetical protein